MRKSGMLAATLLLGALATSAHAHIEFVKARMVSLEKQASRWVLNLEIHEWENGGRRAQDPPLRVAVQFRREPACIHNKDLYLGTPDEFAQALELLQAQVEDGKLHRFGLNATPVDASRVRFVSPNLRVGRFSGQPMVWAVARESGGEHCPLKYVANR